MRIIAMVVAAGLAAGACGEEDAATPATAVVEGARGVTVVLPDGWEQATENLTPSLTDPREVLSVATFPLRARPTGCAHVAGSALGDLGPRDAFVTLQERGFEQGSWSDFPPRPAHFGPELGGPSEAEVCVPGARFTDHWFRFTDGDRHFHVDVAFGPDTPERVRREAWAILDSLSIDPRIRPDWASSG